MMTHFEKWHLELMDVQAEQSMEAANAYIHAEFLERAYAYTHWFNGKPMFVIAMLPLRENVFEGVMLVAEGIEPYAVALIKAIQYHTGNMLDIGAERVECTVRADFKRGVDMLARIKIDGRRLDDEGLARKFFKGNDYRRFAYVKG